MRKLIRLVATATMLTACGGAALDMVIKTNQDAQQLDYFIYRDEPGDAASPQRAKARGAFCALDKSLRLLDAASIDTDGEIVCGKD
jgi:hypothetical protein